MKKKLLIGGIVAASIFAIKDDLVYLPFEIKNLITKPWENPYKALDSLNEDLEDEKAKLGLEDVIIEAEFVDISFLPNAGAITYPLEVDGEIIYKIIFGDMKSKKSIET